MNSAFVLPGLHATDGDVGFLRSTVAAVEQEVMTQYEEYLYDDGHHIDESKWKHVRTDGHHIDESKWKHVRTDGHVRTYKERRKQRLSNDISAPISPMSVSELEPQARLAAQSSGRRVLVSGVVPGTVKDAMYGSCFQDTSSLRATETYQRVNTDDCSVLLKIDGPTMDDYHSGSLHTHLTTLRSGEQVGVSLRYSVKHRALPELNSFSTTRVTLSSVTIYRQFDGDHLEVFGIEFLDDKHHRPDAMHRHDVTHNLRLTTKVCATGFKKKLYALLQQQHQGHQVAVRGRSDSERKRCAVCTKSTKRGVFSTSGSACQLCAQHVCPSCTTTHDIILDASSPNVVTKSFGICVDCIDLAQHVPTLQIAQEHLMQ